MPIALPNCNQQKYLQTLLNVHWEGGRGRIVASQCSQDHSSFNRVKILSYEFLKKKNK
jgi:hypothetical protein